MACPQMAGDALLLKLAMALWLRRHGSSLRGASIETCHPGESGGVTPRGVVINCGTTEDRCRPLRSESSDLPRPQPDIAQRFRRQSLPAIDFSRHHHHRTVIQNRSSLKVPEAGDHRVTSQVQDHQSIQRVGKRVRPTMSQPWKSGRAGSSNPRRGPDSHRGKQRYDDEKYRAV